MEQVTGDRFEAEVLKAEGPVLVYFGAEKWCQPCKALAPTLAKVAQDHADKMKFLKVDVDTEDALVAKYNVMAVPTLLIFQRGNVVAEVTGNKTERELVTFVLGCIPPEPETTRA